MKEQQGGEPNREKLFEALYGYPLRLAEQVIRMGAIPDQGTMEELIEFHQQRIEYVDSLLSNETPQ